MTKRDTKIVVRDTRRTGWYSIDNDLFRGGWAAQIGSYGVAVYSALVMHVNKETQQAWPSYGTLAKLTGISRTKVIAVVGELQKWGMITVQARADSRGQTSNLFTLLDRSKWKHEADIKNGKDETTGKDKYVTKRVTPYTTRTEKATSYCDEIAYTEPGSTSDERDGVREMDGGGAYGEQGLVQEMNGGSSRCEPKQNPLNETHEKETKGQHSTNRTTDGVVLSFSLSFWMPILEKRKLNVQEEVQFQRQLASHLLLHIAPDFSTPDVYLNKLSREQLRRVGAVLMLMYGKAFNPASIKNRAGFLRSKAECPDEEIPNLDALLLHWLSLVDHVKTAATNQGSDYQLADWLRGNDLKFDLLDVLENCGITQVALWDV